VQFGEYLGSASRNRTRLILEPTSPISLAGLSSLGDHVDLLVGPEGGFSDSEIEAASGIGFKAVRLGPRVLRTETAGIAALAVLQALWGDLQ
jgi:16S rRNA (uracil1498-N3)-methyltransferase